MQSRRSWSVLQYWDMPACSVGQPGQRHAQVSIGALCYLRKSSDILHRFPTWRSRNALVNSHFQGARWLDVAVCFGVFVLQRESYMQPANACQSDSTTWTAHDETMICSLVAGASCLDSRRSVAAPSSTIGSWHRRHLYTGICRSKERNCAR